MDKIKNLVLNKNQKIILKILQEGNTAHNLQDFLDKILDIVLKEMKFDGGGIYLIDEIEETAILKSVKNLPEEIIEKVNYLPIYDEKYKTVFQDGQVLLFDNYKLYKKATLKSTDIMTVASIPIISKDKILGALNISRNKRYSFSRKEKENFYYFGQSIGTAVERMMLEEKLRVESEKLKKINKKLVNAIRDRKITEEKLTKKEEILQKTIEADRLKTEFFANISHELRTPLNIIMNVLPLIEPEVKNKKNINIAKQNSYRLLKLINNLIDITKIESNFFKLNLGNYNIVSIIEDITLSIADYVKANNLTIIFDTEIEEKIIACDPLMIERIILNLISNAIKFSKEKGIINVNIYDKEDKVLISVKDNGIGIPNKKLNLIFNRFTQVDMSFTRRYEGSGIGLALVKSLVEMHNGKISVKSEANKGTEFLIEFPTTTIVDTSRNKCKCNTCDNHIERIIVEFSDIYSLNNNTPN